MCLRSARADEMRRATGGRAKRRSERPAFVVVDPACDRWDEVLVRDHEPDLAQGYRHGPDRVVLGLGFDTPLVGDQGGDPAFEVVAEPCGQPGGVSLPWERWQGLVETIELQAPAGKRDVALSSRPVSPRRG